MDLRHHPEVVAFKEAADCFCALLESEPASAETWVELVLAATARLYASAHALPRAGLPERTADMRPSDLSRDEWRRVMEMIAGVLGDQRYYWACFDPSEPLGSQQEPGCGDLADDLADIYGDVKPGLLAWETGKDEYLPRVVFDWGDVLFDSHWGVHAVDAMRALHPIAFLRGLADHNE